MKKVKRFYSGLVLVILFCLTLTCANAAVDEKLNQTVIGFLTMKKTEAQNVIAANPDKIEEDTPEILGRIAQSFKLPAMLQSMEDDAFEGTAFARIANHDSLAASELSATIRIIRLPAMLQIIGDEAFEGIDAVVIEIPEGVESIGERAFAGNPSLRSISIPEKTRYIGKNAFEGSRDVIICGAPGSYARAWARENSVLFSPVIMVYAAAQNVSGHFQFRNTDLETIEDSDGERMKTRPGWRTGEVKAEFYEKQIAHQVQGRSPPPRV